jgi:hypothetical protein
MKHLLCVFVIVSVGLTGCGKKTGKVHGKVTLGDKAVKSGQVMIIASDNLAYPASIDAQGNYVSSDVPAGVAKLAVTSPDPSGGAAAARAGRGKREIDGKPIDAPKADGAADPKNWFPIPDRFSDWERSNITVTIGSGEDQRFDIDLSKIPEKK